MDIQSIMDVFGKASRQTREGYHLTLGKLISTLEETPADMVVTFDVGGSPIDPRSYRGYYEDLAFASAAEPILAGDLLTRCHGALGKTFQGYKGGDFTMTAETPLWAAGYGSTGRAITDARMSEAGLVLATREID